MKNFDLTDIFVVNPAYTFRNDITNVVLTNNHRHRVFYSTDTIESNFTWLIHPYVAYAFSFFNGRRSLGEIMDYFQSQHQIAKETFLNVVMPCIDNSQNVFFPVMNTYKCGIPKHFLIPNNQGVIRDDLLKGIDINSVMEHLDMSTVRLQIPNEMMIMLTTSCITNCIYCYADRPNISNPITFERLKMIIKEGAELNMSAIDVDGGDFFLYKNWRELLRELNYYGYSTQISTKFPITKEIICDLQALGVNRIQLSIDSVIDEEIMTILHVDKNYLTKVKAGVELLDKAGFEITVKPVITKYNDSVESICATIDYFKQFDNIRMVNFTPADFSQFKRLSDYASTREKLKRLEEFVKYKKDEIGQKLSFLGYGSESSVEEKSKSFPNRATCTGNVSAFFVLPDGKVTLCEQMYWHPFFIIGDLTKQTIMEMWQSEKALSLWNFSQKEVRDCSPCKTCADFNSCRRGQGNCWRIAISAYGYENYDFPAPNCPKSLPISRDFYIHNH